MTNENKTLPWVNHTCGACEGSGRRLKPSFRGVYTQDEWRELEYESDGEWGSDYFNPRSSMHQTCESCNGRGHYRKREPPYTAERYTEPYYLWLKQHKETCTCERAIDGDGNELNMTVCEESTEEIRARLMSDYEQALVEYNDVDLPEYNRRMALWNEAVAVLEQAIRTWLDWKQSGSTEKQPPCPPMFRSRFNGDYQREGRNMLTRDGYKFQIDMVWLRQQGLIEKNIFRPFEPRLPHLSPAHAKSWGPATSAPYHNGVSSYTATCVEEAQEMIGKVTYDSKRKVCYVVRDIVWTDRKVDGDERAGREQRYWFYPLTTVHERVYTHKEHEHLACGPFAQKVDFDAVKAYYRGQFEEWDAERQRQADRELYWAESGTPYHERY